jgi:hypothetical protein
MTHGPANGVCGFYCISCGELLTVTKEVAVQQREGFKPHYMTKQLTSTSLHLKSLLFFSLNTFNYDAFETC